jgi:hypothetical protein
LALAVPGRQVAFAPQQPVGQDTASQTQAPSTHRCPLVQAAFAPQTQAPVGAQALALTGSHATQVPPAMPHEVVEEGVQTPAAQQPFGQDSALHTQSPPLQAEPALQGGAAPQRHAPVTGSQVSARTRSQAMQAAPPTPHRAGAGVAQTPPAQQPVGQDPASQVQTPPMQSEPGRHAAAAPHEQAPVVAQLSARAGSQVAHAVPAGPQDAASRGEQVPPVQHPSGQLTGLQPAQTPALHAWPAQSWHAAPPVPHWPLLVPATQLAPVQQPAGQDVASHTHAPPRQR